MGAAVDEWLSIADWDYQRWKEFYSSRTILHQIPRTPLLFEVCIELVCSPGNDQKTLQRGAAGLFALYTFYKTQTGRQQKAVMDIDQFEWFFALQDAARGAPGHRGAHDVQVIFKMLFDDQGVDVALRRRAPLMPPIEEPWPGGLDLRDVAEASRNYDAVRPGGAGSLVADLKRALRAIQRRRARRGDHRGAGARACARAGAGAAPGPLRSFDGARRPRRGQRRGHGTAAAATTAAAADPRAAAQAPRAGRRGARRRRRAGGPQRRRRRDGRRAGGPRGGPAATVSADRPRQRAPAAAGHDEPAAASDDGAASARSARRCPWPRRNRPYAPPPPRRTAGPDNGLQQLRDLLARSDDDDSVPEIPGRRSDARGMTAVPMRELRHTTSGGATGRPRITSTHTHRSARRPPARR